LQILTRLLDSWKFFLKLTINTIHNQVWGNIEGLHGTDHNTNLRYVQNIMEYIGNLIYKEKDDVASIVIYCILSLNPIRCRISGRTPLQSTNAQYV
jgi:hypothetical protein